MTVSLLRLTPAEFSLIAPASVSLYLDAMNYPPEMHARRVQAWRRDSARPGFKAIAATHGADLAGVAYGFTGQRGHWWDTELRQGLLSRGISDADVETLTANYFELAEIHVHPNLQGLGVGTRLLNVLLEGTEDTAVLLSTPEVPFEHNAAFSLYRAFGFRDLLRHHTYPSDKRPFAILIRPAHQDAAHRSSTTAHSLRTASSHCST